MKNLEEIEILTLFTKYAGKDRQIDFSSPGWLEDLSILNISQNSLEEFLYEKTEQGIIYYEEIGEEGFRPIIMGGITDKTHSYIQTKLKEVKEDFQQLNDRLSAIYSFNPIKLSEEIVSTQQAILKVQDEVSKTPILSNLKNPLLKISAHFESQSA